MIEHERQTLIFDFDGVIVDSEVISLEELVNALHTFGVEITFAETRQHFLGVEIPTIEAYVDKQGNMPSRNGFRELWYDSLFSRFKTDLTIIDGFIGVTFLLCSLDSIRSETTL